AVLGMSLALLGVSFYTNEGNRTVFGNALGADFAGFYAAGTLFNRYPADRLYDLELQDVVYHEVSPELPAEDRFPYVYPPFLILLFRALALFSYPKAYLVWLIISGALVAAGLAVLFWALPAIPKSDRPLIYLLAFSFEPLVLECLLGGQTSAIGFFAIAMAMYLDWSAVPMGMGLALALCLY